MEASTAQAPAAADAGQIQPAAPAAPAGSPPVDPTQAPQIPETEVEQAPAEGDLQAQLDAMQRRAEAAESQLGTQPTAPTDDFLTALQGAEQELGISPEELAAREAGQNPEQAAQGDQEAQLSELDAFVQERIDKVIGPMEEARQIEQARGWQSSHPDVVPGTPLGDAMLETMKGLGERYGDEAILDPQMLDLAYTHVKARQADDGAVPAEQAAQHGASIETQAGQTQTGEDSVEEQYVKNLTAGTDKRSFFD